VADRNPYSPPEADPLGEVCLCPKCGMILQKGEIRSYTKILWVHDQWSGIRKLFFGGDSIGPVRMGFGWKHGASHCPSCNLYLLGE